MCKDIAQVILGFLLLTVVSQPASSAQQICGAARAQSCSASGNGPGLLTPRQVAKYAKAGIEAHTGKIADCNVLETLIAIAKAESDMFANCKCQNKTAGGGADWGLWQFNDLYLNSYHPYDFYYNARGKLIIPQPDNRTKPRSKDITRSPQPARNVNGKKLVSPDIPRDSLDPNRAAIQAARVARVTNFGAWKASKNNWQPLVSQHKYLSVAKDVGCYAAPLYKRAQTPPDGGE